MYRHYHCDKNFNYNPHKIYQQRTMLFNHKPKGFWFSVDNSWYNWCLCEKYMLDRNIYYSEVFIDDINSVYLLRTEEQMKYIIDNYSNDITLELAVNEPTFIVDWNKFSNDYSGIIINEENKWLYSFGFGLQKYPSNFIQGWDCLSGCIWNLKVASVRIGEILYESESSKAVNF